MRVLYHFVCKGLGECSSGSGVDIAGSQPMRRQHRKSLHYDASSLFDGTVLAAYPVRKPTPHVMIRDNLRIDVEGVCREWMTAGKKYSDYRLENRFRFMDIMANRLNVRRAIREIALPELVAVREEIAALGAQLDRVEQLLGPRDEL